MARADVFLVVVTSVSCMFTESLGCLCPSENDLKGRFCKQEIVFQGTVVSTVHLEMSNLLHDDVIMYRVEVEKMFRGYLGDEVWLSTSKYTASCGVQLFEGVKYLLSTSSEKSLMSCDWNVPMSSLTTDELYVIHRNIDCDKN